MGGSNPNENLFPSANKEKGPTFHLLAIPRKVGLEGKDSDFFRFVEISRNAFNVVDSRRRDKDAHPFVIALYK